MARYEVRLRKSVGKDLAPLPKRDVRRIVYEIRPEVLIVCVVKVGHRKDVYR